MNVTVQDISTAFAPMLQWLGQLDAAIWVAVLTAILGFGRLLYIRQQERALVRSAIIGELQSLHTHYSLSLEKTLETADARNTIRMKMAKVGEPIYIAQQYLERSGLSRSEVMLILQARLQLRNTDTYLDHYSERAGQPEKEEEVSNILRNMRSRLEACRDRIEEILTGLRKRHGKLVEEAKKTADKFAVSERDFRM